MVLVVFGSLVNQAMVRTPLQLCNAPLTVIQPHFCIQRDLYEVREHPSKTYSWKAFMIANIVVELPWNSLAAVLMFLCWYYPIGLYRNAQFTDAVTERGGLMFLLVSTHVKDRGGDA